MFFAKTRMWRNAFVKSRLIMIVSNSIRSSARTTSSNEMYFIEFHFIKIWSLIDLSTRKNKWWMRRHLSLNFETSLDEEEMNRADDISIFSMRLCLIYSIKFCVNVSKLFLTKTRFSFKICWFESRYSMRASWMIISTIVFWKSLSRWWRRAFFHFYRINDSTLRIESTASQIW